jgi:hypothetical protein
LKWPWRESENPKAAGDSMANGGKARHMLSRSPDDGQLNLYATTNSGEFQGEIPVEYNPKAPYTS